MSDEHHTIDDTTANDIQRKARLQRLKDTRRRTTPGEAPLVSVESVLIAEVDRTAAAHEKALLDLRRWRMSHGDDERPQSIYVTDPNRIRILG